MSDPPEGDRQRRQDRIVGLALALGSMLLYGATLCPTVFWYDSAEYAAAAVTLGIPHPPGYPLYTLVGRLFVMLPVEPALAMNLMSACFGALAVTLAWAVLRRLGARQLAAVVGAATLATGQVFWDQAVIAEVYTPGLASLLGVLLLTLRGLERDRGWMLILAAGLAGLGLGVHLFIATCGLGLAALVLGLGLPIEGPGDLRALVGARGMGRRLGVAFACLLSLAAGACIYLYIPIRAAMGPALNFQNPADWETFSWFVTGGNYKTWFLEDYPVGPRLLQVSSIFYQQLLVVGIALAAAGLVHLLRRRALAGVALALMAAGNIYFFFNYRVHDVQVFFLPAVTVCCLLVGAGAHATLGWLERFRGGKLGRHIGWLGAGALALYPLSMGLANYGAVDLSGYTAARDFGEKLCAQLPRGALIINFTTPPEWKSDAVFSSYFQIVLKRRRDVRVMYPVPPWKILQLLAAGKSIYLYYPVPGVKEKFHLAKEGVVYRITGPRKLRRRGSPAG